MGRVRVPEPQEGTLPQDNSDHTQIQHKQHIQRYMLRVYAQKNKTLYYSNSQLIIKFRRFWVLFCFHVAVTVNEPHTQTQQQHADEDSAHHKPKPKIENRKRKHVSSSV